MPGDLSRLSSETGSLGGLMTVDVDVSWLVVVFILLSDSMSLSLPLLGSVSSAIEVPLVQGSVIVNTFLIHAQHTGIIPGNSPLF